MSRLVINSIGDVKQAINDIYDQLDKMRTQPFDFKQRILTGCPDPKSDSDVVNLAYLREFVTSEISKIQTGSSGAQLPANAPALFFTKSLWPKVDNSLSFGSSALAWLKGWFYNLAIKALVGPSPLRVDASGNVIIGKIDLANTTVDVTGILARANGGFGNSVATPYAGTASGSFSGTISGTADLVTGAVTGTCTGTFSGTTSTTV